MKFLAHENEPRLLEMVRKCVENITIGGGWGGGRNKHVFGGDPDYAARVNQHGYPYFWFFLLRVYTRLPI
jgi:hypothetical protein